MVGTITGVIRPEYTGARVQHSIIKFFKVLIIRTHVSALVPQSPVSQLMGTRSTTMGKVMWALNRLWPNTFKTDEKNKSSLIWKWFVHYFYLIFQNSDTNSCYFLFTYFIKTINSENIYLSKYWFVMENKSYLLGQEGSRTDFGKISKIAYRGMTRNVRESDEINQYLITKYVVVHMRTKLLFLCTQIKLWMWVLREFYHN